MENFLLCAVYQWLEKWNIELKLVKMNQKIKFLPSFPCNRKSFPYPLANANQFSYSLSLLLNPVKFKIMKTEFICGEANANIFANRFFLCLFT